MAKILFTTVFKPFGIDGPLSRKDSFVEVFHNRVTRAHGIFSYRGHFSAFGLHAMAKNIRSQSTVLEYPSFKRFLRELKKGYDYVGIGSVVANFGKVKAMAKAVREHSPGTKVIVGGYCAHIDEIGEQIPLDYLCTGEGISFMRELLDEPARFDFRNPDVYSRAHSFLGTPLLGRKNPHIIIGLGCPYGCDYCSPSHHFGRKYIRFFKTGQEIFSEMERMERKFRSRIFGFIGDDNFLMDLKRAEELRERVVKSGKQYEIFYFASADKIKEFGAERLAQMGTNLVWMGRESSLLPQRKSQGVDMKALIKDLHRHGIKAVVSSMLLMEHHTPENVWDDLDAHLALKPDFSMISLYSPLPGTPFYDRMKDEGRIKREMPYEDWHGIGRQWINNPRFSGSEGLSIRDRAWRREFHELGPSAMRLIRTDLEGYLYMRDSDDPALRARAEHLSAKMPMYRALLWAMIRLAPTAEMKDMIGEVLGDVERKFGSISEFEMAQGFGLWLFGLKEKARHSLIGDVIQPRTTVSRYPGRL
jgi:haloalkane dehalogenase